MHYFTFHCMFLWRTTEIQEKCHGREKREGSCGAEMAPKYHETENIHHVCKTKGALEDGEIKGTRKCNPSETVVFERHCFCEKRSVEKNGAHITGCNRESKQTGKLMAL